MSDGTYPQAVGKSHPCNYYMLWSTLARCQPWRKSNGIPPVRACRPSADTHSTNFRGRGAVLTTDRIGDARTCAIRRPRSAESAAAAGTIDSACCVVPPVAPLPLDSNTRLLELSYDASLNPGALSSRHTDLAGIATRRRTAV